MSDVTRRALERATAFLRGFTPRRLKARLDGPRVFANSVPKSGTNLLLQCLSQFPTLRPSFTHVEMNQNRHDGTAELEHKVASTGRGEYSSGHVFYTDENAAILEANDIRSLLIVRDPRDVATSHYHYVTEKNTSHRLNDYYTNLPDDDERLMASIRGVDGEHTADGDPLESIGGWMDNFLGWMETEYTQVIRFEDLIGPRGGGDREAQVDTVRTIGRHLGVDLSSSEVRLITENTFSTDSSTFRKGLIGDWRNHFTDEHVAVFKQEAGDWLVELDYETGPSRSSSTGSPVRVPLGRYRAPAPFLLRSDSYVYEPR